METRQRFEDFQAQAGDLIRDGADYRVVKAKLEQLHAEAIADGSIVEPVESQAVVAKRYMLAQRRQQLADCEAKKKVWTEKYKELEPLYKEARDKTERLTEQAIRLEVSVHALRDELDLLLQS